MNVLVGVHSHESAPPFRESRDQTFIKPSGISLLNVGPWFRIAYSEHVFANGNRGTITA